MTKAEVMEQKKREQEKTFDFEKDLSINKYKEIEREKVEYESSEVVLDRITSLEKDIISALNDFRTKFM